MVSDIAAIVALILSSISLILQWRVNRPDLRVDPQIEIKPLPINPNGQGGFEKITTFALCIYLMNPSEKPIHISGVFIKTHKSHLIQLDENLDLYQFSFMPFTIEPLRSRTFTVLGEKLTLLLQQDGIIGTVRANVIVQDEVKKQYKSKYFNLSAAGFINQSLF
jgi:hypothetical protein